MPDIHYDTVTGNDADDGSTYALAKATVNAALAAAGEGGTVYLHQGSSEVSAADINIISPGIVSNPTKLICVDVGTTNPVSNYGASPNLSTTGSGDDISISGCLYCWGVYFIPFDSFGLDTSGALVRLENCHIKDIRTDSGSGIAYEGIGSGTVLELLECDLTDCNLSPRASRSIRWLGGSWLSAGLAHLYLIDNTASIGRVEIVGVDLSAFDKTALIENYGGTSYVGNILFSNCLLPSGIPYFSGSLLTFNPDGHMHIDACHTSDGYYAFYHQHRVGYVQEETTIKRQGGADYDGTNEYSVKVVTNADAKEALSFLRHDLFSQPIDITTQKTLTCHIAYDSATLLQNDDIWIEVKYHDATDEALGKWERTKVAVAGISTPDRTAFTDVSGSETWDGISGWTNPQVETIEVDITGGNGLVEVCLCVAKPSLTVYVDPQVDVS